MAQIFVYAPNADDFDCLGECGPLTPTKCVHIEDANGMSEITLEHPIDENNRWSFLQTGYILKAEVPVRTCPEVAEGGAVVTALEKWTVKMSATKGQRYLYSKASGGKKKKLLPPGTEVVVTKKGASRYKAKTRKHSGWIAIEALENMVTLTVPEDPNAIEQVVPAWTVRPQLFRINEAVVGDDGVSVKAQHIFYDLLGNVTTYVADNPSCVSALSGILDGCAVAHEFEGYTNMLDTRIIDPWTRVSPVEALLNPESGLIARWGGELVRDDEEFYVLNRAGMNRGVRIAYGKNLLGVDCTINQTDVITRIMPVGQTKKGKPLLLAAGTYTVDGASVTIDSTLTVAASNADDYPTPHVFVLDVGKEAKAAGTSAAQILAARVKMIRAALHKFADEECNLPSVNLKVDFIALGDTEEYAQYRQLEDVYLYDSVRIYHPKIAVDVTAQVSRVEFDCLQERFNGIELGAMQKDMAHRPVATWQVPSALPGYKVEAEGLDASRLADDAVNSDNVDTDGMTSQDTVKWIASVVAGAIAEEAEINGEAIDYTTMQSIKTKLVDCVTLNAQTILANNATINWAQITTLVSQIVTTAKAQITTANIVSANIDWAGIETLTAVCAAIANAKIDTASISYAQIKDLTTGTALITKGTSGKMYIADLAVTEANMVSLTVGELIVKGTDGKFYSFSVDSEGNVTTAEKKVTNDNVGDNTLNAGKIIENTITARELNVASIFADEALVNAIKAANIDTANFFAANAVINSLKSFVIRTDVLESLSGALDLSANDSINLIVGQQSGNPNLLLKSDFEDNWDNIWTKSGNIANTYVTVEETTQYAGHNSIKMHADGFAEPSGVAYQQIIDPSLWQVGNAITVSAYFKMYLSEPLDDYVSMMLVATVSGSPVYPNVHVTPDILSDGDWHRFNFTYTIPTGTTELIFRVENKLNGTTWMSEPKLEQGSVATGWCLAASEFDNGATARFDGDGLDITQTSKNTHFHADADDFGIYDASDNMIAGVGLDGAVPYFAVNELRDPRVSSGFSVGLETVQLWETIAAGISLVLRNGTTKYGHLMRGPIPYYGPGNVTGDFYGVVLKALERLVLMGVDGISLVGDVCIIGNMTPKADATYNLGTSALRYYKIYSNNALNGSDRRFKADIDDDADCEAFIMALRPRRYRMKGEKEGKLHEGFVAQEVFEAMKATGRLRFAGYDDSDPNALCLAYTEFLAPMVSLLQTQQRRIDDLERRLAALEERSKQ